jgi:hypothetical protein
MLIFGIAMRNAPSADEPAHLASGLYHWRTGSFDAYLVNPPLVRLLCTAPLLANNSIPPWRPPVPANMQRHEWQLANDLWDCWGTALLRRNLLQARCINLVFSLLGSIYCYRFAATLFGTVAARVALLLWAFSPNQLAWSASLCPDMPATALGIAAQYHILRWSLSGRMQHALVAGILVGLAIAAKSTWLLLLPIGISQYTCARIFAGATTRATGRWSTCITFVLSSILVLHGCYLWESPAKSLETFAFQSRAFQRLTATAQDWRWGAVDLTKIPVPFPGAFVQGLDWQRREFESGKRSYLGGEWQDRGWWYYYLACFMLKVPTAYVLLVLIAVIDSIVHRGDRRVRTTIWLAMPGLAFLTLVSSQTGFSHHFRYAFPCLPYAFVYASGLFRERARPTRTARLMAPLVAAGIISSLCTYPRSHGYFSELAGGPARGYRYLLDSNLDWGEDLWAAERWATEHPNLRPLYHAVMTDHFARRLTIAWQPLPDTKQPGWYVISRQRLLDPNDECHRFVGLQPVVEITPSLLVFHVPR